MATQDSRTQSPARLNVLIADEHGMVRRCLQLLAEEVLGDAHFLDAQDGNSVFAHATDPSRSVSLALIDPRMPGMQAGLRLAELARAHPRIPLVVVSAAGAEEAARWLTSIPTVFAFVSKAGGAEQLRPAIEAAVERRKLPFVPDNSAMPTFMLTRRQREIGLLLRDGLSNKSIADKLSLSEGTVKNHVSRLLKELRARHLVSRIRNEACRGPASS
jgi:DNA-binding NarL/FixJ family response regulator